jgi:ABC-type nitrate/sulfonate/bicarbonate transport system substrate-binding protein
VLVVTRTTLDERPAVVRAVVRALQRGYVQAQLEPENAIGAMLDAERGLDRAALGAQLDAVGPAFTAGARAFGELRPEVLREWVRWDVRFGILDEPIDVAEAFDTTLAGPVRNP